MKNSEISNNYKDNLEILLDIKNLIMIQIYNKNMKIDKDIIRSIFFVLIGNKYYNSFIMILETSNYSFILLH